MATSKFRMISAEESGIGGWLLLFTVGQGLQALVSAYQVPGIWHALTGPGSAVAARAFSPYPILVTQELVSMALRAVLYTTGVVLIVRRDPRTPVYYQVVLSIVAIFGVADFFFAGMFHDAFHAYRIANGLSVTGTDAAHDRSQLATIRLILYAVIWLLYWRSSERVRLTFKPGGGMTEIPKTP